MKITEVSNKCLDLIKDFEGFFEEPYLCPAKVPTIGWGTILYPNGKKVTLQDTKCSKEQATEWLMYEVNEKAKAVDAMTTDSVTQNQFDALVSFAYNVGSNALKNSTLLRLINSNTNAIDIRTQFMRWNKADGKVLKGLTRRRKAEADLYFTPFI